MFRQWAAFTAIALFVTPGLAKGIRWTLKVEDALKYARQTKKPLMFYVKGSSGGDDDVEDYERDHKRAFADPRVMRLAERFVCVQLSRSRYRDQLKAWNLNPRTNLEIVFTGPDAERIDTLSPAAISNPSSLAQKMALVHRSYRNRLYQSEIQPILGSEVPEPKDLKKALDLLEAFELREADTEVIALLKRENLPATNRTQCIGLLARFSTKQSVETLLELALAGDRKAAAALGKCTPGGALELLPKLGGEDPAAHLVAYRAVIKICKIKKPKSDRFWEGPNEHVKQKEIERVRKEVEKIGKRWVELNEDYR